MSIDTEPEINYFGFRVRRITASPGAGEIVLSRPDALNPLSTQTLLALERAARWFDDQDDIGVVVVRGEGRAFCAGADLTSFGPDGLGELAAHEAADAGRRMADAIESMNAVTIAAIHGWCVGGGLVLAATCDLRIASADTQFSIPEVNLGIPLAWGGTHRLIREIGAARAKELIMTCRPFGAAEALDAGFLTRIVDVDELDSAVNDLRDQLLAKPRHALWATKRSINATTRAMVHLESSVADAHALMAGLQDPDGREAAARYLEQRGR